MRRYLSRSYEISAEMTLSTQTFILVSLLQVYKKQSNDLDPRSASMSAPIPPLHTRVIQGGTQSCQESINFVIFLLLEAPNNIAL